MGLLDKFKEGMRQGREEEEMRGKQERVRREAKRIQEREEAREEAREHPSRVGKVVGRVVAAAERIDERLPSAKGARDNPKVQRVLAKTASGAGKVAAQVKTRVAAGVRNYAEVHYADRMRPNPKKGGKARVVAPPSPFAFGPMGGGTLPRKKGGGGGGIDISMIGAGLADDMFLPQPRAVKRAGRKKRKHARQSRPRDPFDIGPGFL